MNKLDLDISNFINISKEELESKYNVLKESHKSLQVELESKNQLIYDNKRQLQVYEQLEKDFHQEIELVQKLAKCEVEKYEIKIQRLEENVSDLNDRNQYLETCVFEREEEKVHLEFELKELVDKISLSNEKLETVDDNCQREIRKLKEENEQLKKENEELLLEVKLLKEEIATFEEKYEIANLELENAKENLSCKKSELAECKNVCTNLQEEVVVLKSELEGLRSKPLDTGAKGNSLFAEVNDKRLEVQDKMSRMKQKYLEMKRDYGSKLQKISELRAENQKLAQQLEENNKLQNKDYEYVISTLKSRAATLEDLLERTRADALQNQCMAENTVDDDFKFIQDMMEPKNKEIEELKERLKSESQSKILTAVHLRDSNKELRQWKAVAAQLKCKIDELESKISELEHLKVPLNLEDDVFENDDGKLYHSSVVISDIKSIKLPDDSCSEREIEEQTYSQPNLRNIDCSRNSKKAIKNIEGGDLSLNATCSSFNTSSGDNKENVTANSQKDLESNCKDKKVVTFTTETVEKTNLKQPLRKGGRVLDTKTWYIPSKSKK
ncbi:protein Spindly isoform X2 [Agrilus planipennis]|uniref:Protein Spindly isoform X2 n=1 Tax=Agrilus planipennis TaxID=224129 RepID=A0A1W4W662_AGRPL|nr:protein Spindly isoform X2 [Agrilus planipennis]